MKRIYINFIFCALPAVAISSCSDKIDTETTMEVQEVEVENEYSIPIESAITSLDDFLVEKGMIQTKGSSEDSFKDIESFFKIHSLYVVNFKDNKGYALLSADRRIPEDIIAVFDSGNITEEAFDFSEPIPEPGKEDDLSVEKYREMAELGALAVKSPEFEDWRKDTWILKMCLDYANNRIVDPITSHDTHSVIVKEVPRLVETAWGQVGQDGLFNKYSPLVGINHNHRAAAGCVSVALAQIVAYHEYPFIKIKDGEIDYTAIKKIHSYSNPFYLGTAESREMLSNLMIYLGLLSETQYYRIFDSSNGFSSLQGAADCLRRLGYESVKQLDYSYEDVAASLDRGCPVFMSGTDRNSCGHAWIVDGYMIREFCSGGCFCEMNRQYLLHCNWGWYGQCNGYFTSGIFSLQNEVIKDNLQGGGSCIHSGDYSLNVKMITCRKPSMKKK